MSEVTTEQTQSSASTTEQAKERLEEGALQIKEKASEAKVPDARATASPDRHALERDR